MPATRDVGHDGFHASFHLIDIRSKDAMVRPPVPKYDNVPYRVHVLTTSANAAIALM